MAQVLVLALLNARTYRTRLKSRNKSIIEPILANSIIKDIGNILVEVIYVQERQEARLWRQNQQAEAELTCMGVRHRVFGEEQKVAKNDEVGDNEAEPRVLEIVPQVLVHIIGVLTLCVQGLSPH